MTPPNHGTEGFRDAIRGGQDYIKPRGVSHQNEYVQPQERNVAKPPPKQQPQQPQQSQSQPVQQPVQQEQQQQQKEQPPPRIPFPKLSPGRKRNYRPPHVVSAMKVNAEMHGPDSTMSNAEMDDYCDSLNPADHEHCFENFREGRESTRFGSGKGPDGNAAAAAATSRVVEQLPLQQVDIEPVPAESVNGDREPSVAQIVEPVMSENVNGDLMEPPEAQSILFEDSTVEEEDNEPNNSGSLIEHFRDGPRSVSTRSGSDVDTTEEPLLEEMGNDPLLPADEEPNPLLGRSSFYENLGPSSMNFRDGKRMSVFKDDAFNVDVESKRPIGEKLLDERDLSAEESAYEELLGESFYDDNHDDDDTDDDVDSLLVDTAEGDKVSISILTKEEIINDEATSTTIPTSATPQPISTPITAAETNTGSSKKSTLLSIDPKTIDIIPLNQGKAAEEGEQATMEDDDSASNNSDNLKSSSFIDPIQSNHKFSKWEGLADTGSFVKMFRGSASYIANHRGTLAVYHIPGELLTWEGFPGLMDDIALTWLLGMKIVLVAGCRHQIDLRLDDIDNEEEYDGEGSHSLGGKVMMSSIRVTDEDTLRVVKEEAGFVRFEIERRLAKSLRLHGGLVKGSESLVGNVVSGNFYSAQPFGVVDGIDYCWTGFPRKVEIERIRQVHETNDIVLLTSLGVSPSGEIFNVNSEFLAATVAGSMSASKIIYFNVHGTSFQHKLTEKPVQNLRVSDAKNLLAHYKMRIHPKGFALVDLDGDSPEQSETLRTPGSMETLIKIGYSMVALEKGVKRAHILAPENGALVQELYTRDGCGTLISRDIYEGIRRGDVNDVSGIYDLIDPLVRSGTLVERPKSKLEKEILSYYVYTRDGLIVATGQLKRFEGGFAEIGCLVVSKDYRRGGKGDAMLGYLERLSLQCGAKKVFVLSTQTMEWFVERGFREVPVESLPPSRQALYNKKRKSKIYMKEIDGDRDLDAAELWWSNKS